MYTNKNVQFVGGNGFSTATTAGGAVKEFCLSIKCGAICAAFVLGKYCSA